MLDHNIRKNEAISFGSIRKYSEHLTLNENNVTERQ